MLGASSGFGSGVFCVSLDFELYYGVSDLVGLDRFRPRLDGARRATPRLLELFERYGVRATWATVGLLFAESGDDALRSSPARFLPDYRDKALSNYRLLGDIGESEGETPWLLASSLIKNIRRTPGQEVATHTFSHFYALEPGASLESFEADLWAAVRIAERRGLRLDSIVFPRNQYGPEHLEICRRIGLSAFRGNPPQWMHRPANASQESRLRRATRLMDAHLPWPGSNLYRPEDLLHPSGLANVAASRFLRPADAAGALPALLERRIRGELERAAGSGRLYHLWWHPHNFGGDLEANLRLLERVLESFSRLRERLGMRSLSMSEVAEEARLNAESSSNGARQRADAAVL